jgi:hypothetical protein
MKAEIDNKKDAKLKLRKHLESLAVKRKPYVFAQDRNRKVSPDKSKD